LATDIDSNQTKQQTPEPVPNGHWLNAPNSVTIARLGLAIVLFWMIWFEGLWISAAIVFVVAALTDALDGYLARKYGQVTVLGRILDPFVDKFIICGAFVFLLEKKLDSGVNSWIVIIVIGREMFVSSLRGILEKEGRDFSANMAGKIKMVLQCAAVTGCLLSLSPDVKSVAFNHARDAVLWLAVAATVWSGLVYVFRAYKLFTKPE
jgi:CDP-diacylglycerol--glycerol-3-phosphate 3-phosphatidyltransferase